MAEAGKHTAVLCPSCNAADNKPYIDGNGKHMRACGRCLIQWQDVDAEKAGRINAELLEALKPFTLPMNVYEKEHCRRCGVGKEMTHERYCIVGKAEAAIRKAEGEW